MDNPDFASALDFDFNDVERPKPLPEGDYVCVIKKRPRMDKSSVKETKFVEWTLHPMEALDSVNEKDLDEALTRQSGEKKALSDMSIRATFYLTEDALWRLKKFLQEDLGLDVDSMSPEEAIDATVGCEVIAKIRHRRTDDGTFADLKSTSPVNPPEKEKKKKRA